MGGITLILPVSLSNEIFSFEFIGSGMRRCGEYGTDYSGESQRQLSTFILPAPLCR